MLNRALQGATAAADKLYIESVFSTWLYTGTGTTQTITNGIDLAGKGGLVWIKSRSNASSHRLIDSARGVGTGSTKTIYSNTSDAESTGSEVTSFNSNGLTLDGSGGTNTSSATYASWTFRKAAKFFDVVTYTGDVTAGRQIAHNLGSTPGVIIVKNLTSAGADWIVYHRSLSATKFMLLASTNAAGTLSTFWNNTEPTSTHFTVGDAAGVNAINDDYVAYLFAHDAGGFGDSGSDSVVSCGTFTASATETATVTLGYEPQWLLFKPSSTTGDWQIVDTMRPWPVASDAISLKANLATAEANVGAIKPSATGFYATSNLIANATYIYIAIRRGPMKTPTDATKVFNTIARTGTSSSVNVSAGFPVDLSITRYRSAGGTGWTFDRMRGATKYLRTSATDAEATDSLSLTGFDTSDGVKFGADTTNSFVNYSPNTYANWFFRRAPGFFDVVAYTGTGSARTVSHNLGVAPELMIVKSRTSAYNWAVYSASEGATKHLLLNTNGGAVSSSTYWNSSAPSASVFNVDGSNPVNGSTADTYVAYLFATLAGVSKVGSYTGTGTTKDIDCGFTAGARFVLIKRTDSTGNWYIWDSARGIVSGNDPYLLLNSTAAEVTNTDYIDPLSSGFQISSTAPAEINASGGSYIFLAVA